MSQVDVAEKYVQQIISHLDDVEMLWAMLQEYPWFHYVAMESSGTFRGYQFDGSVAYKSAGYESLLARIRAFADITRKLA